MQFLMTDNREMTEIIDLIGGVGSEKRDPPTGAAVGRTIRKWNRTEKKRQRKIEEKIECNNCNICNNCNNFIEKQ